MLFALGDDIGFVLKGGRKIDCPVSYCMLRDDDGKKWPECSLLIMKIPAAGKPATDDEVKGAPRYWLGKDYDAVVSTIDVPSRDLSKWKLVGEVERVYYDRFGTRAPGPFKHSFNRARGLWRIWAFFKGKKRVQLYRMGKAYRLELQDGCVLLDVGLVLP